MAIKKKNPGLSFDMHKSPKLIVLLKRRKGEKKKKKDLTYFFVGFFLFVLAFVL